MTDNEIKISILNDAKEKLQSMDKSSGFGICYCIYEAANGTRRRYLLGRNLRNYIGRQLDYNVWLTDWLKERGLPYGLEAVRSARLQWLDWMIASLEGKN